MEFSINVHFIFVIFIILQRRLLRNRVLLRRDMDILEANWNEFDI